MLRLSLILAAAPQEVKMHIDEEKLKKALRKIGKKMEGSNHMETSQFTEEDVSLLYSLGYGLYEKCDYKNARTVFQRLVFARPYEIKYWTGLGAAQQMVKDFDDALTSWAMVSLLNDKDPLPHFHAAECYLSLKQFDEASKALSCSKERINNKQFPEHRLIEQKVKALEEAWDSAIGL